MGRITCQFFQKQAPNAVANFIGLATGAKDWTDPDTKKVQHHKPLYDGTTFHRVIPGFMIQGGDPTGTGMGDPGFAFADEFDPNLNFDVPGRLAMANSGPDTNGSQFFVTEQPYPSLDQHYTIFGQCDEPSVEVVKAIAAVDRDSNDKPLTPVELRKVTIVPEGKPLPPLPPGNSPAQPRLLSLLPHPNLNSTKRVPQVSIFRPGNPRNPGAHMALAPGTYAVFTTSQGKITVRLFEADAPITVKNFIDLAEGSKEWTHPTTHAKSTSKLFDGTIFHRVIPDFMIQGGDPAGTGMGGPGYRFQDETKGSAHKFDKPGKLAMANSGPGTNGCQFFITVAPTPWLTGNHTIFGEVVEGQEIANKISLVPRGGQDKPKTPVVLESVIIERVA